MNSVRNIIKKNKYIYSIIQKISNKIFPSLTAQRAIVQGYSFYKCYPTISEYRQQIDQEKNLKNRPLISVIIPTYNTDISFLSECIESVLVQSYSNWELCIVDDCSSDSRVRDCIRRYAELSPKIKYIFLDKNSHISLASNKAVEASNGEFISLLDHDDILWPNALFECVKVLNEDPSVDFVYTDEDKIDSAGEMHLYPFLKPDWSPDFLESCNYITHFSLMKRSLFDEAGGFRKGFEGAQDWDLFLRASNLAKRVQHIQKILYSWRIHSLSTAEDSDNKPYVYEAQRRSLEDDIERKKEKGVIVEGIIKQHSFVQYFSNDSASVIIFVNSLQNSKNIIDKIIGIGQVEQIIACLPPGIDFNIPNDLHDKIVLKNIETPKGSGVINHAVAYSQGAELATKGILVFIDDAVDFDAPTLKNYLVPEAGRSGIGVVGGRALDTSKKTYQNAGYTYGASKTVASILGGVQVNNLEGIAPLYAHSRRNILAVDHRLFSVARSVYKNIGGFDESFEDLFGVKFAIDCIGEGLRNIYNPKIILSGPTAPDYPSAPVVQKMRKYFKDTMHGDNDPYYNSNFIDNDFSVDKGL